MEQTVLFGADLLRPTGPPLSRLREEVGVCSACRLRAGCARPVFGAGQEQSPVIAFVGEAPGADEDAEGQPFVGRAGKLLNDMIGAMGLQRTDVYICNVVNCRPPKNRKPEDDEMQACRRYLEGQLRAVRPRVIVALGGTAAQAILGSTKRIGELMGHWHEWAGVPLRPTFHPAYLLRDPAKKSIAWNDLQAVMLRLGLPVLRPG